MEDSSPDITHKGGRVVLMAPSNLRDGEDSIRVPRIRSRLRTPRGLPVDLRNTLFARAIMKQASERLNPVRPHRTELAAFGSGSVITMLVSTAGKFSAISVATLETGAAAMHCLAK